MSLVTPTVDEVLASIKSDLKSRLAEGFKFNPEDFSRYAEEYLKSLPLFIPAYSVTVVLDKSTGIMKVDVSVNQE